MEQPPLELVLIRHGESIYNRDGTGELDCELTELGVEQARMTATWLNANFTAAAIYASPLVRARQTAEIASADLGVPIQYKEDLREVEFELPPRLPTFPDPAAALTAGPVRVDALSPEYREFESRVVRVFCDILTAHQSGTVLVFSHGGVISTFLRSVFGAHHVSVYAENCSALLLRWQNSRWYLVYSNHTAHLASP